MCKRSISARLPFLPLLSFFPVLFFPFLIIFLPFLFCGFSSFPFFFPFFPFLSFPFRVICFAFLSVPLLSFSFPFCLISLLLICCSFVLIFLLFFCFLFFLWPCTDLVLSCHLYMCFSLLSMSFIAFLVISIYLLDVTLRFSVYISIYTNLLYSPFNFLLLWSIYLLCFSTKICHTHSLNTCGTRLVVVGWCKKLLLGSLPNPKRQTNQIEAPGS